jgi:hypothetical protein
MYNERLMGGMLTFVRGNTDADKQAFMRPWEIIPYTARYELGMYRVSVYERLGNHIFVWNILT